MNFYRVIEIYYVETIELQLGPQMGSLRLDLIELETVIVR